MTSETALEAPTETDDPYADTVCSNCSGPVKRRRPSLTGKHFCTKRECQRAKDRFHYRRRAENAIAEEASLARSKAELRDDLIIAFVTTALQEPRVTCADCGRGDAVPGYAHPHPEGGGCTRESDLQLPVFTEDDDIARRLLRAAYPR